MEMISINRVFKRVLKLPQNQLLEIIQPYI